MQIKFTDFNNADLLLSTSLHTEWNEIETILNLMPLHLKGSDQDGRQGQAIFDAVGTNEYLKTSLSTNAWLSNVQIPPEFNFLGTDIDFYKSGIIVEAQFSNYPFLLNNLLRSELFFKAETRFSEGTPKLLVIITKAHLLPASNSTLYYEQAVSQIKALTAHNVFAIPIRVVGLTAAVGVSVSAQWTEYHAKRYSRTIVSKKYVTALLAFKRTKIGRCTISLT